MSLRGLGIMYFPQGSSQKKSGRVHILFGQKGNPLRFPTRECGTDTPLTDLHWDATQMELLILFVDAKLLLKAYLYQAQAGTNYCL